MVDERNAQRGADVHKRRMNRTGYYTSNYFECIDSTCVRVSNDKQKYYLNIAAKIAIKSPMFNHKHGAVIVAAISSIRKKQKHILNECDIYVVRIGPDRFNNPLKYSRPCTNCSNTIIKNNIKNAFYSTNYEYDIIRGCVEAKKETDAYDVNRCVFQ